MERSLVRIRPALLPVLVSTCLVIAAVGAAPSSGERTVHITFIDEQGHPVTDLSEDEIRVQIGGEEAEIVGFYHPDAPFNVGLVMDVSPSKEAEVDPIRQATARFVEYFPLEDPFLILTFDSEIYVDCDWTTDRKKVDEAIWEYGLHKPGGSTILYETVVASVQQKFDERRPRTAMILFTDGVDTGSKSIKDKESINFLKTAGVLTYVIQQFSIRHHMGVNWPAPENPDLRNPSPSSGGSVGPIFVGRGNSDRDIAEYKVKVTFERAAEYLRQLAQAGGGLYFNLVGLGELGKAYEKIASELIGVYTIVVKPAADPRKQPFHKVYISTTRSGVIGRPRPDTVWK